MVRRWGACAAHGTPIGEGIAWNAQKENLRNVRELSRRKEDEEAIGGVFVWDIGMFCFCSCCAGYNN